MIKWKDIPVKSRKEVYKEISRDKSLLMKTVMFKDMYKGLECVVLSCGASTAEFPKEKIEEFCKDKPVFTVKTATTKYSNISDVCITNLYATCDFPKERDYLIFARQEMPLGYDNWINPDLVDTETLTQMFSNEPNILWGSDVSARHSNSVVNADRWDENSLQKNPFNRIIGPGIMNDMVVPILVHCGISKVSILGWDGANIQDDGSIRHFYDIEPLYKPDINYVSNKFNLNNLKSDTNECEQQIAKNGELSVMRYLRSNDVEIEILTKNSTVNDAIDRNYVLYGE